MLALDVGDKRIGVAVSDPFGFSGTPLGIIQNNEKAFEKIKEYINQYKPKKIIIGLPLTLKGEEGEQAKKTKAFAEKLKEKIPDIDIVFEDERFTTSIAEERLSLAVKNKKKMKKKLDSVSAVVILESYLSKNPL
nr:Holliday junction resolvase RuvX [Hydrogenothermus marinus]